jgi:hypothetical protein
MSLGVVAPVSLTFGLLVERRNSVACQRVYEALFVHKPDLESVLEPLGRGQD